MVDEYTPNSHRYKEERKQEEKKVVKKVVTGPVKVKKKNEISKLKDMIISEDASSIKSVVLTDVILPGIKGLCEEALIFAAKMLFRGTDSAKRRYSDDRIAYRSLYDSRDRERDRRYIETKSRGYTYDDIIFRTRGDAELVLTQLEEIIDRYGMVSIADYNEAAGVTGEYTDVKYGWKDLRSAEIKPVRDGYIIDLPRAKPL